MTTKTSIYKVNLPTVADTVYVEAAGKSKVRAAILDRMTIEKVEGAELVKLARGGKAIIGADDDTDPTSETQQALPLAADDKE